MIYHLDVHNKNESPGEQGAHEVPTLASVAPDLELVAVAAYSIQVLLLMEPELVLPIVPAVVVIKQEIVVGGHRCNA